MPDKILVHSRLTKAVLAPLASRFTLLDTGGKPAAEVFPNEIEEVTALLSVGGKPLTGAEMDKFPKLGAIICFGTGYDGIDLAAAAARNIDVGHSPGANASSVADVALTLMLAATRRLTIADQYVRSGDWAAANPSPWMRAQAGLRGRKIGVYGMGEIGRRIAARAAAFETEVGYFSRTKYDDLPYQYLPSLDALAEWCSVLMVAVRAGAENQHAVNAALLKKLGPDGYVVNISRGSVIDEAALVVALKENIIAGAGLDVFETEPHAPSELTTLPNVVLTPHIGGNTTESLTAMQGCVIANFEAFFAGKALPYQVR